MLRSQHAEVEQLGRIGYADGLALQERVVREVREGKRADTLLLLEHDPVITLGRGSHDEHVLVTREALAALGVEVCESGRGGDVTYHGPGQLVGYPVLNLSRRGEDIHAYLRELEEMLMDALAGFGIRSGRQDGLTGVWTLADPPKKIAAIGVRVQRWVTSHGFALNVNADLDPFDFIVPCGLHGKEVTSMAVELGTEQSMENVRQRVAECFLARFAQGAAP